MNSLDPPQLEIAHILFELPAARDFALAGGSALLALGAIDRPTRDIDAFMAARPGPTPGDVRPLAADLTHALLNAGWEVALIRSHQTFTRHLASQKNTDVEIDLAVDSPPLSPIESIDGIPVLAPRTLPPARPSPSSIAPKDETSPISTTLSSSSEAPTAADGLSNSTRELRQQQSPTPSTNSIASTTMNSPLHTRAPYVPTSQTGPQTYATFPLEPDPTLELQGKCNPRRPPPQRMG